MSEAGERLIEGAKEALEVARGNQPAARIHVNGHAYVPERQWQPIETAPKDGTRVLLFTRWPGDPILPEPFDEVQLGWWDEGSALDNPKSVWHRPACWSVEKIGDATHWMPLPPPPGDTP